MELEACVAEMGFDGAFRAVQAGGNLFYGQVLGVVEEKYLFASLCETLDRCAEVCPEFLAFKVSAGVGMRLSDMAFICGVQGFDVVCFLFSEIVDTDVFSDADFSSLSILYRCFFKKKAKHLAMNKTELAGRELKETFL